VADAGHPPGLMTRGAAAAVGHRMSPQQQVMALLAVVAGHRSPARVWTVAARPAAVSAGRLALMRVPLPQILPCLLYSCVLAWTKGGSRALSRCTLALPINLILPVSGTQSC